MKILFVVPFYPTKYSEWGGVFFHNYARGLVQIGHEVTVLRVGMQNRQEAAERGRIFIRDQEDRDGVRVEILFFPKVPKLDGLSRAILGFFQRWVYRKVYGTGRPDVAHLHFSEADTSYSAARWLDRFSVPYVVTEHSTSFLEGSLQGISLRNSKRVFSGARDITAVGVTLQTAIDRLCGVQAQVISNGVDPQLFFPKPRSGDNYVEFITVAVLVEKKNHRLLVRCFAQAFRDKPNYRLTILGEGPERDSIQVEIRKQGMEGRIFLPGKATNLEVRDRMQASDFFVLPSRVETFGVVALEALACGLPSLVTRCGGPEQFVRPGVDGLIVTPQEEEITEGLRALAGKTWDRQAIAKNIQEKYSVRKVAENLEARYKKAMGELN